MDITFAGQLLQQRIATDAFRFQLQGSIESTGETVGEFSCERNLRKGNAVCMEFQVVNGFRVKRGSNSSLQGTTGPLRLRSEEHTSELQSPCNLVCRLLLEKKK